MHNKSGPILWGSRLGDFMSNKALRYGPNMTLAALLEMQDKGTKRQINCHQLGEIVSFNPETQTAEVKVKMSFLLNGKITEYPLLLDCPCIILSGGKGNLTFPITPGDSCLVLFNDRDMDNWYSGGQTMPPRTDRLHDFSDAIALVGLRNKQNEIQGYFAQGTELKCDNSSIKLETNKITVTAPYVNINSNVNVVQSNVDDNSLHAYIISSYHSGTDWYRVYSDKWCEQGGKVEIASHQYGSTPVNLLKTMADTNYTITLGGVNLTQIGNYVFTVGSTITTSSFNIWDERTTGSNHANACYWEVKGYIA